MSTTTNRDTVPAAGRSVDHRLARLLDAPLLARVVPHLPPETLHQLIQYRGLDACGELVASATPAQLTAVLDLDLWRGRDDQFDVDRFGEWLEVLVDTGEAVAARTLAALDEDLVVAGLSRYLRVFDPGTFEPTESSDDEASDRHAMMHSETSADAIECEVGGYLLRARRTGAWDAIVTLLTELETGHNRCFHALMAGCRRLSNSTPEIDGLDDLLQAPEQHLHDVATERERRRSAQGYATPAEARAFLQMARQPRHTAEAPATPKNPIAVAYFRAVEDGLHGTPEVAPRGGDDVNASIAAIVELLAEAGVPAVRPRELPGATDVDPRAAKRPLLTRLMAFAMHRDEHIYVERTGELGFLANTLLAGCSVQSRPFTPQEATDAAACICNLGLECWPAGWPARASPPMPSRRTPDTAIPPGALLLDHDLVTAFEVGWSVLHRDVSLFAADQLIATLDDLRCIDSGMRGELRALRRALVTQREAGTPWLARNAAEVLAMLDATAWVAVLGLLDECPNLPAALGAILERRTSAVSPTAFEFISTTAQIGDVRVFMRALPSRLSS